MNIAELMLLDPERVRVASEVYEGYARAHADSASLKSVIIRASCLTIAASYTALSNPVRAKGLFEEAAVAQMQQAFRGDIRLREEDHNAAQPFHEGKMSFARTLAVCGSNAGLLRELLGTSLRQERWFYSADSIASLLLAETMFDVHSRADEYRNLRHRLMEDAHKLRSFEVGQFHIPLIYFIRLAGSLDEPNKLREELPEIMSGILNRVEQTMDGAVGSHNWRALQYSILPIEPEILGLCLAADGVCRLATRGESNLSEMMGDRSRMIGKAYIEVAVGFAEGNDRGKRRRSR